MDNEPAEAERGITAASPVPPSWLRLAAPPGLPVSWRYRQSRPTVYRSLGRTTALPPLPVGTRPSPDLAEYANTAGKVS